MFKTIKPAKLLRYLTSKQDIDQYLRIYGIPGIQRTAVIKVGGEIIDTPSELHTFVESIGLLKEMGLFPCIVHGAGPQMNALLEDAGIEPTYLNGMRVTTGTTLSIAKQVFRQANTKLVDACNAVGLEARPITNGVFEAEFLNQEQLGFVGDITNVIDDAVQSAIHYQQIPILSSIGETECGQLLNINADVAARKLAVKLQPYKTIFVTAKGGWIEDDGTKLKAIDMSKDYERMASRDYTGRQGTLLKLNEIKLLLDALPDTSSVVLTSAEALTKEILNDASEGTVCVKGQLTPAFVSSNQPKQFKVGLLGARGYVGREVLRLLGQHPHFEITCASSRALEGQHVYDMAIAPPVNPHTNEPVERIDPSISLDIDRNLEFCNLSPTTLPHSKVAQSVDIWILALPNGHSHEYIDVLQSMKPNTPVIIDLSADQRFNDKWVYGLPELYGARESLKQAKFISNPGCYATGAQLGLAPLFTTDAEKSGIIINKTIPPMVFGVSGYSGAGTTLSDNNNPNMLNDNLLAYKPVQHIHEQEISHHLDHSIGFMPHVAPYFRGIHLTISAYLESSTTIDHLLDFYTSYYQSDRFLTIQHTIPQVASIAHHPGAHIGGFTIDPSSHRLVFYVTLDNLCKGAATQALQNLNLALAFDEYTGNFN